MNVTLENLAPCKKLLRVELDAQAVDAAFEDMTRRFQREAALPGFRPGKAPRQMVLQRYATDIDQEVKRKLIPDAYRRALTEHKLQVVGRPDIEEIQFGRGQSLQFAATIETAPEFELPAYKGLPVKRESLTVMDADMERAVNVLREQRAAYNDVARPAQAGDFVVVNYTGTCEGKPITATAPTARGLTEQKNFWMRLEKNSFIPGFTGQLAGAQAGDRRTVTVDFPADFVAPQLSGRKGVYEVEVVQVKERVLPEVNEEFAKSFGAETLEKLHEGIRRDLQNELDFKQTKNIRNQLAGALLAAATFDLPESMLAAETRIVVYDLVRENQQRGVTKEMIEKQKEEIYNFASASARERVKATFLLNRIAQQEGLKVEQQELAERIYFLAEQNQMRVDKFAKLLQERHGYAEIEEQLLVAKVLDFLQQNARIEDVPPGTLTPASTAASPGEAAT